MRYKGACVGLIIIFLANLIRLSYEMVGRIAFDLGDDSLYDYDTVMLFYYTVILVTAIGCRLAVKVDAGFRHAFIVSIAQLVVEAVLFVLMKTEVIMNTAVTSLLPTIFSYVSALFVIEAIRSFYEKNGLPVRIIQISKVIIGGCMTTYMLLMVSDWIILIFNLFGGVTEMVYSVLFIATEFLGIVMYLIVLWKGIRLCRRLGGKTEVSV